MSTRVASPLDAVLVVAGLVVWSLAFVVFYGVQGTGCALGWDRTPIGPISVLRLSLLLLWLLHLAAVAGLAAWTWRRRRAGGFYRDAGFTLSLAALAATFGTGAPILIATMCG